MTAPTISAMEASNLQHYNFNDAPDDKTQEKPYEHQLHQVEEFKEQEISTGTNDHNNQDGHEDDHDYHLDSKGDDVESAFNDEDEEVSLGSLKDLDSQHNYGENPTFDDGESGDSSFELYYLLNTKNEQPIPSESNMGYLIDEVAYVYYFPFQITVSSDLFGEMLELQSEAPFTLGTSSPSWSAQPPIVEN